MKKAISPEEVEARDLEEKARQHLRDKDYDAALATYQKAIDIYGHMGWQGQVGILKKEVERIQTMKKFFAESAPADTQKSDREKSYDIEKKANNLLKKAQDASSEQRLQEGLDLYKQALQLFDGLGFEYQIQKIRWEIQKLDQQIKGGGAPPSQPSIAEERAERIERERSLQEQKRKLQESIRERERIEESKAKDQVIIRRSFPIPVKESPAPARESPALSPAPTRAPIPAPTRAPIPAPTRAPIPAPTPAPAPEPPRFMSEQRRAQMEKMKELEEKKRREKEIETKAFDLMDRAKKQGDLGKFSDARDLYLESIKFLEQGNWTNQVDIVKREIAELKEREVEFRKKEEQGKARREAQERDFQSKLQDLQRTSDLEEKERAEKRRVLDEKRRLAGEELYRQREEDIRKEKANLAKQEEEKRKAKSPEYVKKVQLAEMTLAKAQKFESAGKPDQALDRYKYLLELYKELEYPQEKINEINEIIKKLKPN